MDQWSSRQCLVSCPFPRLSEICHSSLWRWTHPTPSSPSPRNLPHISQLQRPNHCGIHSCDAHNLLTPPLFCDGHSGSPKDQGQEMAGSGHDSFGLANVPEYTLLEFKLLGFCGWGSGESNPNLSQGIAMGCSIRHTIISYHWQQVQEHWSLTDRNGKMGTLQMLEWHLEAYGSSGGLKQLLHFPTWVYLKLR